MKKLTEEDLQDLNGAYSRNQALCDVGMGASAYFLGFAVSAAFGPVGLAVYSVAAAVGSGWVCSHAY